MAQTRELYLHELDVAWIIALWKAIHGGDPSPEVEGTTVLAAAALASQLAATHRNSSLTFSQLQQRLGEVGIEVSRGGAGPKAEALHSEGPQSLPPTRQYCFRYNGETYCVDVPRPKTFIER
ncbi:hypothetical protein GCM10010441_40020 [Kitasatospora paracochleata]|uniref:Uncharacterized protein n=1 Tax=Kitasatospora paracochleata TaxID=58354 RepID=A0ABT1IVW3_9ACTN|nr:hypothetical protein [Kitasatospora paracochleata]MCP2309279.1 hypothetical protein [Kitasatospora paracochleata]